MYIPYDQLPATSRVWIYQAGARLSPSQEQAIAAAARSFCEQWVAHGAPLRTSFQIIENQFLVLAVDEDVHAPSGCSIDTSVHMLKDLQRTAGVDFLDRTKVPFSMDGTVRLIPITELRQSFVKGILGPHSETFHVLADTKEALERRWRLPVKDTWMVRYLSKTPAN